MKFVQTSRLIAWISRSFWLVMLVGHAAALWGVCAEFAAGTVGVGGLVRILALGSANLLFALKIADVSWLRVPANPRAWIGLILIIALVHAGVPAHLGDQAASEQPFLWQLALVGGFVILAVAALRLVRSFAACTTRATRALSRSLFSSALDRCVDSAIQFSQLVVHSCRLNRAPPLTF